MYAYAPALGASGPTVSIFWLRTWSPVNVNRKSFPAWATSLHRWRQANCLHKPRFVDVTLLGTQFLTSQGHWQLAPAVSSHVPIIGTAITHSVTSHFCRALVSRSWLQCWLVELGVVLLLLLLLLLSSSSTLSFSYHHRYDHHEGTTKLLPSHCRWRTVCWRETEEQNNWSLDAEFCDKISHIYVRTQNTVSQGKGQSFIMQTSSSWVTKWQTALLLPQRVVIKTYLTGQNGGGHSADLINVGMLSWYPPARTKAWASNLRAAATFVVTYVLQKLHKN